MLDKKNSIAKEEKAVLVGLVHKDQSEVQLNEYLDELSFLAETAGAVAIKRFTQKLAHPDSKTFIGKGKLEEIKKYCLEKSVGILIFDDELSGAQINNIEKATEVKTIDRSDLILDIFARRAKTAQAKAQVELAQYQYILPRLRGMWKHLERLGGGIGTRGPGETEIETDRRIVRDKISLLRKRLSEIDKQAFTQRKDRGEFIRVALVGYTNVGKSTLMKLLSKSDVFAENKLFATLDTTTRKVVFETTPFLLSDTVGFIRKLPHHLVESLNGDWQAAFPLSLGRFPLQGAGKRYVHGGVSLQEVVVPVLHVNIARADDISKVEVDLLRVPPRITTGQVTLSLYQAQPIADKVLARPLQIGIVAPDGTPLSELRTLPFDSADAEPRQRESTVGLTLSKAADAFNNQEVEIRLVETVAGSNQTAIYKYHKVRLQKPFASDFDD